MTSQPIADDVLDAPIEGTRLKGRTLREELAGDPTLLVFLRHFG